MGCASSKLTQEERDGSSCPLCLRWQWDRPWEVSARSHQRTGKTRDALRGLFDHNLMQIAHGVIFYFKGTIEYFSCHSYDSFCDRYEFMRD